MRSFVQLQSLMVPIDRANVDTDALIPKQFMKSISRTGFGDNLFDEWRYLDRGEPGQDVSKRSRNPDFVLNQPRYMGAKILLARENFGCGSSREHAVWALNDHGIRVLLAPSFADIFFNNCFKNGLLPIALSIELIEQLFNEVAYNPGYTLSVDLPSQTIRSSTGMSISFDIDSTRKHRLLNGLDDIGITLQNPERIRAYEERQRVASPWLFN
ncbi:3-isopropylmalate dehydratase small subunit [Limnohabitans sp. MMS-10A-160]|uniref:3-isopropylmalate dehydratase small subunit n=1 Tax=unclassified Limnohabitans TaxID=2626134 RepID=UPI000D3619B2|nr:MULTISPECIES: 3-isopropylmalate dehydratase small subunit [unclassified Limnohabitans]PUE13928.1 3-isopropylmalate dehydratase small subunit [Limnohabitans sp. MMS-10A-192]PUE22952.1 3-isopropylmalate dehydratase small subunit [Limnohabitans sp. MMS-10A-160]